MMDNELYHHGVLGMRWGVRNAETKARYARSKKYTAKQTAKVLNKVSKQRSKTQSVIDQLDVNENNFWTRPFAKLFKKRYNKFRNRSAKELKTLDKAQTDLLKYAIENNYSIKVKDIYRINMSPTTQAQGTSYSYMPSKKFKVDKTGKTKTNIHGIDVNKYDLLKDIKYDDQGRIKSWSINLTNMNDFDRAFAQSDHLEKELKKPVAAEPNDKHLIR